MEISSSFSYTAHCPPEISGNGRYIAYVTGSQLIIRSSQSLATKRIISLPHEFARRVSLIRWDNCIPDSSEDRLALATAEEIRTFSIDKTGDPENNNSSNASAGSSTILPGNEGIANIEWWSCRYSPSVVHQEDSNNDSQIVRLVVYSKAALKISIWSSDGLELELPSPKFSSKIDNVGGGGSSSFSLLCRPLSSDIVQIIDLQNLAVSRVKNLVQTFSLHGCLDIKDAKWSPNGKWLASTDTPSMGYRVCVWGRDGTLVHTYSGVDEELGAQSIKWLSDRYLLIGDLYEQVVVLDTLTYQPVAIIKHGDGIYDQEVPVWAEDANSESGRIRYRLHPMPFLPAKLPDNGGIFQMEVSLDNSLLATQVSSMPFTVFIWSLELHTDKREVSLLSCMTHSSVINTIAWNSDSSALLITPSEGGLVGIWRRYNQSLPLLQELSIEADFSSPNLKSALWIPSSNKFLFFDSRNFSVGQTANTDNNDNINCPSSREGSPQLLQDDDTKVRDIVNGVQQTEWTEDPNLMEVEDTFHNLSVKQNG